MQTSEKFLSGKSLNGCNLLQSGIKNNSTRLMDPSFTKFKLVKIN